MRYLLDTHVMIWMMTDPSKIGRKALNIIEDGSNILLWSAVSFWELTVKISLGKLSLSSDWVQQLEAEKKGNRILDFSLEWRHCCKYESLPWHHRDPFDRLLVCQALCEGLSMITKDRHIEKYEAPIIW